MGLQEKTDKSRGLVYSTEHGRVCPSCNKPVTACLCVKKPSLSKSDGAIRVARESKGRKGAGVTIISGLPLGEGELVALAKKLKQRCACGGTVKNGIIEIQGDKRELILTELARLGFAAKKAGG